MTIRIYDAFSGNNSGTYALLGTFEKPEDARRLRDELARVFVQQEAWLSLVHARRSETSPLHEFMRDAGVPSAPNLGAGDDWPDLGEPPSVASAAEQVLVFVPYIQSFSSAFGELIYKRGGRVTNELEQSQRTVALVHRVWTREGERERAIKLEAFREAVEDGELRDLQLHPDGVTRTHPILRIERDFLTLVHAPYDPAEALQAIGQLAQHLDLETDVSLIAMPKLGADPLRLLRAYDITPGDSQVILWQVGARLHDVVRAARSVTGLDLAEATELVHRAPIEVLKGVSQREAEIAFEALRAAGADVEILGPQHFPARETSKHSRRR